MAQFLQAAPILVTCDLDAAMRRYRLLGFEVSAYTGPDGRRRSGTLRQSAHRRQP